MKYKITDQDGGFAPYVESRGEDQNIATLRRTHGSTESMAVTTQRAIAASLGTTQATVSRALRGDLSLPPRTRSLIIDAARQMGYCPKPHLSVLVEHIRAGRKVNQQGCIAVLVDAASESGWLGDESTRLQYRGFVEQASLRGYRTECFYLRGPESREIDRILNARGIVGLLFAGGEGGKPQVPSLRWERYAMAAFDGVGASMPLNRVSMDRHFNVSYALGELQRRGCRRIGLSLPQSVLNGPCGQWLGGFLASQHTLRKDDLIPVFIDPSTPDSKGQFQHWFNRWRPDVVLCRTGEEGRWIEEMGFSTTSDAGVVCLNRPAGSRFSGVEENSAKAGAITCDLIVHQLIHNEQGLPGEPRHILVEGTWKEGIDSPLQTHPVTQAC